jgi:hypothetical protein
MESVLYLLYFVAAVTAAAGAWRVFEKAGKPGWAVLVPVYNAVVLVEIVGKPVWWAIMLFLPCAQVPVFAVVAYVVWGDRLLKLFAGWLGGFWLGLTLLAILVAPMVLAAVVVCIDLAKKFGKERRYGVGLALLPPVFFPMLGFGNDRFEDAGRSPRVVYHD